MPRNPQMEACGLLQVQCSGIAYKLAFVDFSALVLFLNMILWLAGGWIAMIAISFHLRSSLLGSVSVISKYVPGAG